MTTERKVGVAVNCTVCLRPRALRAPQAAAYLSTSAFQIEELMRAGILPYRLIGDSRVIDIKGLDAYFENVPKQIGKLAGRGKFLAKRSEVSR